MKPFSLQLWTFTSKGVWRLPPEAEAFFILVVSNSNMKPFILQLLTLTPKGGSRGLPLKLKHFGHLKLTVRAISSYSAFIFGHSTSKGVRSFPPEAEAFWIFKVVSKSIFKP